MALREIDWENGIVGIDKVLDLLNNELSDEARAGLNAIKVEMEEKALLVEQTIHFTISYKDYSYYINDVEIPDEAMDRVCYSVIERDDEISELRRLACEAHSLGRADASLMDDDVEELMGIEDDYVLSSGATNEYLSFTNTYEVFNAKCQELLTVTKYIKEGK